MDPSSVLFPDLHVHTSASDGQFSPEQVITFARERNVNLLAITDHDTLDGFLQVKDKLPPGGMKIIPGVEISAGGGTEVHILGYGVHTGMKRLMDMLQDMREERRERAAKMVGRLTRLGLDIDLAEIAPLADGSLGRAHIGRAMVQKGLVGSLYEAFEKYLSPGRPGFEPRRKLKVTQVLRLLTEEGAVPVVAHPGLMKMELGELRPLLYEWMDAGLLGLEAYHPSHLPNMIQAYDRLARENGLLVTGGSDFHGEDGRHPEIGFMLSHWPAAAEDAKTFMDALSQAKPAL
jgi:predicted metal-dependent phosphoesterase TrpH